MNPYKYLSLAKEYAKLECLHHRNYKHVSIVVVRSSVVAIGVNRSKTHPLAQKYSYRFDEMHSELDAYIKIRHFNYKNATLINYRFSGLKYNLGCSKPCTKCRKWVYSVFNNVMYYTLEKEWINT